MVITSAVIFQLLTKMSGYEAKAIYTDLGLTESSANRFRLGYASSPKKPGWWPNQCDWFCSYVNMHELYKWDDTFFIKATQAFPLVNDYEIIEPLWRREITALKKIYPKIPVKQVFTYEKAKQQYTFSSHVFDTLRHYYHRVKCNLNSLNKLLEEILEKYPEEKEILASYDSADDKFGFLINECLKNSKSSANLFEWNRKETPEQPSDPTQLELNKVTDREMFLAIIQSVLDTGRASVDPETKTIINTDDLISYMGSSNFQIHLSPADYIVIIQKCRLTENSDYVLDWCDLAVSKYTKVQDILEISIAAALGSLDFSKAQKYIEKAQYIEENLQKGLLERILDYYEDILLLETGNSSEHVRAELRNMTNLYIKQFPNDEAYFYSKAQDLLADGKRDKAQKLLLSISTSKLHAPACCALLISLILQEENISSRAAFHIISIAEKGIDDCPETRPDLLAYLYLQCAEMKRSIYLEELKKSNTSHHTNSFSPEEIRNDYQLAHGFYSFICTDMARSFDNTNSFMKKLEIERRYAMLRQRYKQFPPFES